MTNYEDPGNAQPLLSNEEDAVGAWEGAPDVESPAQNFVGNQCTVNLMLKKHAHDALRFLQTGAMEKIAEFEAEGDMVFGAFGDEPLLTMGCPTRLLKNPEEEWQRTLKLWYNRRTRYKRGATAGWAHRVWVQAFVVTVRRACDPGKSGLLHPLLRQWMAKRCSDSVFSLPAVQSVISFKWNTFARRLMFMELTVFCCWLIAYYAFTAAMQDENLTLSLSEILKTVRGRVTVVAEVIALAAMAPFLAMEIGSMGAHGWSWLRDPSNKLALCTYTLQIIISVTHLGRIWVAERWLTYLLAIQCILLMFRLQYYTQCIRATRFSFPSMVRGVLNDVGWILLFVLFVCVSFGAAIHINFRKDSNPPEEYDSFTRAVLAMVEHVYGDLELKDFLHSENPVFGTLLALTYILVMGYVLINLVLGVIITSIDRIIAREDAKQLLNKARIIDDLESTLPAWWERNRKTEWHPEYVHVLRINPDKLDSVALDALWTRHGEAAPVMPRRGQGAADQGNESEYEEQEIEVSDATALNSVKSDIQELRRLIMRQESMMEELLRRGSGETGASFMVKETDAVGME